MGYWIGVALSSLFLNREINRKICISYSKSNRHEKMYLYSGFVLMYIILFLFRGLRADCVGGDLLTYESLFYRIGNTQIMTVLTTFKGYEKGWLLINKIIYLIFPDFQLLLLSVSAFYTFCLFKFLFTYSNRPAYSLYLYITQYFLAATFNNERQTIAIGILFLSIKYVKERKLFKFIVCVYIASLFHLTSIVFFVVYFMYGIKINYKYWICVIYGTIFVFIFSNKILSIIIKYLYNEKYGESIGKFTGEGYSYFAMLCLMAVTVFVVYYRNEKQDPVKRIFAHMIILAMVLQIFSFQIGFIYRATRLFSVAMIVYIPDAIDMKFERKGRYILNFVILVLTSIFFIYSLLNDGIGVIPYKFFWEV